MAAERAGASKELSEILIRHGLDPETLGSGVGQIENFWVDLRSQFSGGNPARLLADVQRIEKRLIATYEEALAKGIVDDRLREDLQAQLDRIRSELQRLQELQLHYR